jgi:DcmR-like sensory protein
MTEHFVQFYEEDAYLVSQVAGFIRAGLHAGDAVVVVATKPHRNELEKRLRADAATAAANRPRAERYVALDAAGTLSKFFINGQLDEKRFGDSIAPILRQAADSGNGRVRVFGEMVALLCTLGMHKTAIQLEELWNNLATIHSFSLFCAYPLRAFPTQACGVPFLAICNEHARVVPAEGYIPPANAHEHYRAVASLQQKAAAFEIEMSLRRDAEKVLQQP